jgi:zinc protease
MTFIGRIGTRLALGALAAGFALSLGIAASAPPPVHDTKDDVVRATLANGLRVIIVPNRLAPVVATSVNYLVGSDEAPAGFPGTAHAQEHMMFRGSPDLTADQLADIGSVMGGNFNANTRESLTQYLFTVPSEDLDVALHIEAIRMAGVLDTDADWAHERGAIEQEVAQDLSDPDYVVYEKLRAQMYAGSPYDHVALGTRPSFDKTTATMLRHFHDSWYAPNNAILVIVGDLDAQATLAKIKALFGPIKAKTLPPRPAFSFKPPQAATYAIPTDRPNGTAMIAIRMPGLDSKDFPVLEVLSDVLSSHRYDLYGMVPEGKAIDATFSLVPLPKSSMAFADVSFPAGEDPKAVVAEIRAILAKAAHDGLPPELVKAAIVQEQREAEFQKNAIPDLASVWSDAVALYGLKSPDDDLVRIEKVTPADVNRAAKAYLDVAHASVAVLEPQGSGAPVAESHGFGGQESIALGEAKPTPLPDWAEAALNKLAIPPQTTNPVVSTLPNGLTLIVQPETVSDTVSIYGHIRNRPETEAPPGKYGVNLVLDQLFPFGSESLDRIAYQQALDDIGASEAAGPDFELQVLANNFDRGAALMADNELHPALPEPALEIARAQVEEVVAARNKSPSWLAQRGLREALFDKDDPSLHDATPETIHSLTRDDVLSYYHSTFRPDLTTIVVIGKVTPEQARATIEKYFGGWAATGPKPNVDLPPAPPNKPGVIAVPDASRVQDTVILTQNLGVARSNPDYYPLSLGSAVLGGGFYSTRLSIDLRKNTGLVYGVNSTMQIGRVRGVYFIEYACDPQNVSKAAEIATQEIRTMQDAPVTADELLRVKALLLRQIPLNEASVDQIARGFLDSRELDLPLDEPTEAAKRYVALGPAEIQAAFKKWMRPDDLVRITQGPAPQ